MEVRQGCHNSETHHNSSKRNNFGIRIYTKEVQNKNKRLRLTPAAGTLHDTYTSVEPHSTKLADNNSTPPFPAVHENELSEGN